MKYDSSIIDSYFKDMKTYVLNDSEALKIEKTYRSISSQIANKSKKFQFSKIDKKFENKRVWITAWLVSCK